MAGHANPHVKTKSIVFRPLICLDSDPYSGCCPSIRLICTRGVIIPILCNQSIAGARAAVVQQRRAGPRVPQPDPAGREGDRDQQGRVQPARDRKYRVGHRQGELQREEVLCFRLPSMLYTYIWRHGRSSPHWLTPRSKNAKC